MHPPISEYLAGVRRGLRCPLERRPEVMEELCGHLLDRADALMGQGLSHAEARRQALREMGPGWFLALRLSLANGWSPLVPLFRQIWAMGLGFQVLVAAVMVSERAPEVQFMPVREACAYGVLLALLLTFGFAMGRIVRSWAWAITLIFALIMPFTRESQGIEALPLSAMIAVFVGSVLGSRRESPSLARPAWAAGGAVMLWWLGSDESARGLLVSLPDAVVGWAIVASPWLLWLSARGLEQLGRRRLAGPAE